MKRVYTATGLPAAYLLRDHLIHHGIETTVFNEHGGGAIGEIPCDEGLPQLWILNERQYAYARALIVDYEQPGRRSEPWSCPGCREQNPANFDFCWNCGKSVICE